jgi:hypothetical protein
LLGGGRQRLLVELKAAQRHRHAAQFDPHVGALG